MEELHWKIEERNFMPKTADWFWALGIFGFALIVSAVLLKNYLLIVIVALAAFIIHGNKNRRPEIVDFRLNGDGLYIGEKFYSFDGFESFWIFPAQFETQIERGSPEGRPAHLKQEFVLRRKERFIPLLTIPFYENDEQQIRNILTERLEEKEERESLVDLLSKRFF